MTTPVLYFLVFLAVGAVFLAVNLIVGRLVRPNLPSPEKMQVYECGEEPVGSAWIQFDIRFYVIALLFVIFDVEIAFFFPWALVFGDAIRTGHPIAEFAFFEFLLFFAILLLGFAYLWKRGDLEWVRSTKGQA